MDYKYLDVQIPMNNIHADHKETCKNILHSKNGSLSE